jgi:hypothetical protein
MGTLHQIRSSRGEIESFLTLENSFKSSVSSGGVCEVSP